MPRTASSNTPEQITRPGFKSPHDKSEANDKCLASTTDKLPSSSRPLGFGLSSDQPQDEALWTDKMNAQGKTTNSTRVEKCPHCKLPLSAPMRGPLYEQGFELGRALKLTGSQARIFAMLYAAEGKMVNKKALFKVLYHQDTDFKIIDVQVHKMRKRLDGTGWHIRTEWGVGLRLCIT